MKPSAPTNDLARPWADGGDKTIIPESEASAPGRATLEEGFPYVTQLPINSGGVAPNRTDFNGILYLLSALNFWQQSGGQASWKSSLSYVSPAIVHHNSNYWVAVAESGPDTSAGAVTPGTDETYWQELLAWLAANSSNSGLVGAGNTVKLTGDTTGAGTFGSDGNVTVDTTTAVATALRTGRNISLTGDASGSLNYNFDGTRDVSISATVSQADRLRNSMKLTLAGDVEGSVSFNGSSDVTMDTKASIEAGDTVPPGTIAFYAGSSVPAGWLICNGSNVSRTTYADLYSAIGTTWGSGNGSSTFGLPDFRNRFPEGVSTYALGKSVSAAVPALSATWYSAYEESNSGGTTSSGAVSSALSSSYTMELIDISGTHYCIKRTFSASNSNSSYSGSTVQPAALAVYYIIKT